MNYTIEKVPFRFTNVYFVIRDNDQKILGNFDTNNEALIFIKNLK